MPSVTRSGTNQALSTAVPAGAPASVPSPPAVAVPGGAAIGAVDQVTRGDRPRAPQGPDLRTDVPPASDVDLPASVRVMTGGATRAHSAASPDVLAIAERNGMLGDFPPEVHAEVQAILAEPGIDDPALVDLTRKPFITIDNADSRDLDQAMCIERRPGGGYVVYYALADASYYVRPGTAMFDEALRRGSSYYMPGFVRPMLPRALSEGLVSLNPGVDRRALVFEMELDAQGKATGTKIVRARMRSRKKLTYDGVQRFHDHPKGDPHAGHDFTETLQLLREVGELRIADAAERDVVRIRRRPSKVFFDPDANGGEGRLELAADLNNDVERWNEQLSLLCNTEGALLFERKGPNPALQPIFRTHDAPTPEDLEGLAQTIAQLVATHGLDTETWCWHRERGESLADYLERLPQQGPGLRVAQAIHRQAMLMGRASTYGPRAAPHYGVGARAYARFSSPMREMVGIFVHKEAVEMLEGRAGDSAIDEQLRARIIESGVRAKDQQARLDKEVDKIAIDALFSPELERPEGERPSRRGTVLGVTRGKVYIQLDSPPIEIKVYLKDLAPKGSFDTGPFDTSAAMLGGPRFVVGGAVDLRVLANHDGRWSFDARPA